jgi:hypothetical protein
MYHVVHKKTIYDLKKQMHISRKGEDRKAPTRRALAQHEAAWLPGGKDVDVIAD